MTARGRSPASRGRGRPPGPTPQAERTRQHLYDTAMAMFAARGEAATTLREIAGQAGVSVGLLYRYFPGKAALVLAFYDERAELYAARAAKMPAGPWAERFLFALRTSLAVLAEHRATLSALLPILVRDDAVGLLAPDASGARERVRQVFHRAVIDATNAPPPPLAAALGNLLYVAHLGIILGWLLDRSPGARATAALLELLEQTTPLASLVLPFAEPMILATDAVLRDALLGD